MSQNNEFKIAVANINGYLQGLSSLCHGLNYVPIYKAIICPKITNDIYQNIQLAILAKYSQYRYSRERLRDACKCGELIAIDDWKNSLDNTVEKWIVKRLFDGKYNVNDERYIISGQNKIKHDLVRLIEKAFDNSDIQVSKFQIGQGSDYIWGFDNESYAFSSENKLFVITLGWAD